MERKHVAACLSLFVFLCSLVMIAQQNPVTLTPVRETAQCVHSQCDRHVIVFVHGLWGSDDTWSNGSQTWPQLITADHLFDGYDIYLASYGTSLGYSASGNNTRLTEVARGFSEYLPHLSNYRGVHLIGHSMGGNVILTSFIMLKLKYPQAHDILSSIGNVILLGTPVDGADLANFAWIVSSDIKLVALKPVAQNELPVLVELGLNAINEKREILQLPSIPISAGFELDHYDYVGPIIVSQRSATKVANPWDTCGFHKDHKTLVKPANYQDPVYIWVSKLIRESPHSPCPVQP